MNRKFLAGFLAASLVLTAAPVVPGMEANADAEELSIGSQTGGGYLDLIGSSRAATGGAVEETLTGTKWWDGSQKGKDYTFNGDGTFVLNVKFVSTTDENGYGAFNVELENDGKFITTGSDDNAWTAPEGLGTVSGADNTGSKIVAGHEYKISIVRANNDFSVVYYDLTEDEEYCSMSIANADMGETVKVHIIAQVGTYEVSLPGTGNPDDPTTPPTGDPDDPATPPTGDPDDPTTPPTGDPDDPATPPTGDPTDPPVTGDAEILTGTAWWTGNQVGKNYPLKGDGTLDLFIGYIGGLPDGAFSVELVSDGNKYITTGSDINIWTAESATGTVAGNVMGGVVTAGHKYKVSVTRQGQDFTIIYFDMTDNKEHCKLTATGTNMGEDVNIHVMAQVGKYMVNKSDFDMPEVNVATPKPLAPYPIVLPTPEPVPTLPPADENSEGIEMDFAAFWSAHLPGVEITESGTALTYRNETHSSATGNYQVPFVVAYAGDEAKVNGAGYDEYAVIRADSYAWTTKGADANTGDGLAAWNNAGFNFQTNATADTWNSWVADNKAGLTGKIQAIKANGKIYIEFTNGSVRTLTSFAAPEGKKVYFSLAGEECKISNIKPAAYTAIDGINANPAETPAPSADPSASPDPSATAEPGSTEAPGTTDPGTNPGDKDPGTDNPAENPSDDDDKKDNETKKTMKVSGITAKAGKKKVTGKLSVKGTKVTVKIGSKKAKNAKVNGKKFTFTASSKLKKGTKVTIKVTKSGYKAVTKTVKVK